MRTRAYRYSRSSPAFPAQWVTAYAELSLETNSSCLHRQRIDGSHRPVELCKPPPASRQPRAPGPHGFAVRSFLRHQLQPAKCLPAEAMSKAFKRRSSARCARSRKTALRTPLAPDAAASTATRPNVRDDGQRPSSRDGMAGVVRVIWVSREAVYFCERGWTGQISLKLWGKSCFGASPIATTGALRPSSDGQMLMHGHRCCEMIMTMHIGFNEDKVCDAVLRRLEQREGWTRKNCRRPERENHAAPVELVCNIGSFLFALEHTGIEPFEGHVRLQNDAITHFRPLEDRIALSLPATEYCRTSHASEGYRRTARQGSCITTGRVGDLCSSKSSYAADGQGGALRSPDSI